MGQTKTKEVEREYTKVHQHDLFNIVEHNKEFMIAVGNSIIDPQKFGSLKAATNYIDSKPWKLIVNTTCFIMDKSNEIKNK